MFFRLGGVQMQNMIRPLYVCDPEKDHPCYHSRNCAWCYEDGRCACTKDRTLARDGNPIAEEDVEAVVERAHAFARERRERVTVIGR